MKHEDNPRSIKYYVKRYLYAHKDSYKDKLVVDFPAGNGVTSGIIREIGGVPVAFDLFPEYFRLEGIKCLKADIRDGLPLSDNSADALICQEGLEHFSDQLHAFREFNRVLKPSGTLLITTPNYSNLQSKLSYLLTESEKFNSAMPPNEIDSIWMMKKEISPEIYLGHIFLMGIHKLRVLAKLSGFSIQQVCRTRYKTTSCILFPFLYPLILAANKLIFMKSIRKQKKNNNQHAAQVYREIYKLAVFPRILLGSHLMIEFRKIMPCSQVRESLESVHHGFFET